MKAFLAGYMAEFRDHIVRVLTVLPRTAKAPDTVIRQAWRQGVLCVARG
jgi:hypothetical protein